MNKNNQLGRTLIEVIGVLAVIGLVSAGAIRVIAGGIDKYKQSRIGQQLVELQKVISQRFGSEENYANAKLSTLINEKIAPPDMVRSEGDNNLYHRFGGKVELEPALTHNRAMRITFEDVPKKSCIDLITMKWVMNDYTDLYSIKLDGKLYTWPRQKDVANVLNTLPITMDEAMNSCKDNNKIEWVFL